LIATNREAAEASALFEKNRRKRHSPGSGSCYRNIDSGGQNGAVAKDSTIMLNITGGGEKTDETGKRVVLSETRPDF